jgi:hypothetical protein
MNEELKKYDSLIEDIVDELTDHGFKGFKPEDLNYVIAQIQKGVKQTKDFIYLAVPYSDPNPLVKATRFEMVNEVAAKLMGDGKYVFSPISHTHPIALAGDLPGEWQFWEGYDRRILSFCTKIVVLKLDGWENSKGVNAEIKIGQELGIPVEYVTVQEVLGL